MRASSAEDLVKNSNWLGLWTLYAREVRRFTKVYNQTVVAPVVTTMLYLAIFSLAFGRSVAIVGGVPFIEFMVPGLVVMAISQNGFANTSSSLIISKVQGNIVDTLMPPLTARELTMGFAFGGLTRGLVVGVAVATTMIAFVPLHFAAIGFAVYFAVAAALLLSLVGIAGGVWAEKFDQIASVTNFIVMPLSFLSGTFYSVDSLPPLFRLLTHLNPFFYMIDGFRYGCLGRSDSDPWLGVVVLAVANTVMWVVCHRMFATGYKLKA